jgi:hypothetical protein
VLILQCQKVGKLVRFKQKGQKQASFLAFHKCCQGCLLRGSRYISTSFILVCALQYKIHLYSLRNRPEKLAKGSLFCLFLKFVQINFIFTDNVRILYISPAHRFRNHFFVFLLSCEGIKILTVTNPYKCA